MQTFSGLNEAGIRDLFQWQGYTKPAVPMQDVEPRVNQEPLGASGRAHYSGFIQFDELNAKLVGNLGLQMFDNMYRTDPHVRRNILAVWSPIAGASWEVVPFGGDDATDADRYAAELCEWALWTNMKPNFTAHLATLGPVLLRSGFAPFEQIWQTAEYKGKKVVVPRKLDLRLPRTVWRRFQDEYGQLTAIEQLLPNSAVVQIPASELLYYRIQIEGDNWEGTSLLRQAFKPWYFKEHLEKIDAIGQERKAVGVPLVYPPTGAKRELKEEVETALANLHVNDTGYLILPGPKQGAGVDPAEGWLAEVITFDSSSGDTIQKSIEKQVEAISAAFLADFLELGHHQVGARATAEVQDDPFLTFVGALGDVVTEQPNELIARIAKLNVPGITGPPKLKIALHDDASLSELASFIQLLVASEALTVDPELEDYLRQRADMPPANPKIRAEKLAQAKLGRERSAQGLDANGQTPHEQETGEGPGGSAEKAPGGKPPQPAGAPADVKPGGMPAVDDKSHSGADPADTKNGPPVKPGRQLDTADGDPVTAPWYERLLSQGKLKEALDTARDQMQAACTPAAHRQAESIVASVTLGAKPDLTPSDELVSTIQSELERLYGVGAQTVQDELAKQHRVLGTRPTHQLDDTGPLGGLGAKFANMRQRAQLAAQNVVNEVYGRVHRSAIAAIKGSKSTQDLANEAADGALRVEALTNASAAVNEGRNDAASANRPDVAGGIYTSVMDANTCDVCASTDNGEVQTPEELETMGPPNPDCAGGDKCRCMIVWVLSEDPRAIEVLSEGIA